MEPDLTARVPGLSNVATTDRFSEARIEAWYLDHRTGQADPGDQGARKLPSIQAGNRA